MRLAGLLLLVGALPPQICAAADEDLAVPTATIESTSPTLPPVASATLPGGNVSCAFDSVTDLVERAVGEWAGSNISLLVDACPEVCNLVYGTGNPDISGIGAMSSYVIQGVSSLLFGPFLGILALYAGANPDSDSYFTLPAQLWVSRSLVSVARSIHGTNMIIAFSVLFATLIRVRQVCPVAERNFLQHLVGYEVLVAIICTLSYLPMHESSWKKKTVMCCYVLGTIIMVFIARDWTDLGSEPYASTLEAITKYCVEQHDWPVPEISFALPTGSGTASPIPVKEETWPWLRALFDLPFPIWIVLLMISMLIVGMITSALGIFAVAILLYLLAGIALGFGFGIGLIKRLLKRPYNAACRILGVGPLKLGAMLILTGFASLCAALVWTTLAAMLVQRQELRAASGNAYQDNKCK